MLAFAALLAATGRADAAIVDENHVTTLGEMRGVRTYMLGRTGDPDVVIDERGQRVAQPPRSRAAIVAGTLVGRTGVAERDLARGGRSQIRTTFRVPCATTRLAPDQVGYVYFGRFTNTRAGALGLTEIGLQLNPPPGGGTPRSVQLYARRSSDGPTQVIGTSLHVRCDRDLTIAFAALENGTVVATFAGPAIPFRSSRVTLAELPAEGERRASGERPAIERITALAVLPSGSPLRRGSRLALREGDEPAMRFERDVDFVPVESRRRPGIEHVEGRTTEVAIDER